ncbi:MAG: MmgE/PrpD family protein [Acetobacteraceae bacterium]
MPTVVETLAEYAAAEAGRVLPEAVRHHARRALIDWFAALLPGSRLPPATLLDAALDDETGGRALVYTSLRRAPLRTAALINAAASHTIEFDDIFRDAVYHPGCPVIGAALAAAQARGADGPALLRAIVVGYEVSTRIGLAVQPSHYRFWHTTGTIGTFGAAAAVASLLDLDAVRTAHALASAGTMAAALQQAFRSDSMSKPLHAGHAAEAGALAAMGAARGMTGALDVLEGKGRVRRRHEHGRGLGARHGRAGRALQHHRHDVQESRLLRPQLRRHRRRPGAAPGARPGSDRPGENRHLPRGPGCDRPARRRHPRSKAASAPRSPWPAPWSMAASGWTASPRRGCRTRACKP